MRFFTGIFILIFLCSCTITSNVVKEEGTSIEVLFCPDDMCKEKMLGLIGNATDIKCAFYDLDIPEMISALKAKKAQVVIEDSNKLDDFYTGYSFALMHNKFCIFDSYIITSGSMNPTMNDNYKNNNNLVIIRSKALAENYLAEFNELKGNIYGKGGKVKNPIVYLGDIKVENYFCPEDNCKLHVINALKEANRSIYFMTFSFTDEDIGNLVWNKHYQGADVKGIFDREQISDYSRYEDLNDFSIIDKNKYKLHHKVFIIDNKTVITGSFNPSQNANEKNDENVLIIHDKEIAELYIREFNKLYAYEDSLPEHTESVILYKIMYDAPGSDEGSEYVELKNIGDKDISLDYYILSDNKTSKWLSGNIKQNSTIRLNLSFALKNKEGMILLRKNQDIIDMVYWEGIWKLDAGEGKVLIRKDSSRISEAAWIIG